MCMQYSPQYSLQNALRKDFFERPTPEVAQDLIGTVLVRTLTDGTVLAGRIVETEAYLHEQDAASHSYRGKTKRNEAMFGEAARLYVYRIYGIHYCANIVTETVGRGAAVLLRAVEPLEGLEEMMRRRKTEQIRQLCNGPGKLAQAFDFTMEDNHQSLLHSSCCILPNTIQQDIAVSPRIGITKAANELLRFYLAGNEFVSRGRWKG